MWLTFKVFRSKCARRSWTHVPDLYSVLYIVGTTGYHGYFASCVSVLRYGKRTARSHHRLDGLPRPSSRVWCTIANGHLRYCERAEDRRVPSHSTVLYNEGMSLLSPSLTSREAESGTGTDQHRIEAATELDLSDLQPTETHISDDKVDANLVELRMNGDMATANTTKTANMTVKLTVNIKPSHKPGESSQHFGVGEDSDED